MYFAPSPEHPCPDHLLDSRTKSFQASINLDLVKDLARRHNDDKFCRISEAVQHGYYFSCISVTFPDEGKEWVVRIPVPTTVDKTWEMIQSEVATTRYIQRHTSIPVPTVHAYGKDERLTNDDTTLQSYIITDRISGNPLSLDNLLVLNREKRARLFSQLGDALAQLQELTFPTTGSLYPDEKDDTKIHIGPSLCQWEVDISNRDGVKHERPPLTTTWDSIHLHLGALARGPALRKLFYSENGRERITREMFALDAITRHVEDKRHTFWREDAGFTLNHSGLYYQNILIDGKGNIQGIINWSKAEILPRQLSGPPTWILCVGNEDNWQEYDNVWAEFQDAIHPSHPYRKHLQYYLDNLEHAYFATTLRWPRHIADLYFWRRFYDTQHDKPIDELLVEFFDKEPARKEELERRIAEHREYAVEDIGQRAGALSTELPKLLELYVKVRDLIVNATTAGILCTEPCASDPLELLVPLVESGGSPLPSDDSGRSGNASVADESI
ncbi:Altered inheritance of mitochondria protein 9, mitochondrial [Beauveria bassiana]|uniref:Altered inheritance of mitochondria protein 9, mitochondrial n=1 Tax=Beauveria bassiana TaxID=176275 RepID=A0A2N6NLI1_BEABA|nr:Altered inheritance of mitochondria protein 9, mitochondrial [Beauveria bassiana]